MNKYPDHVVQSPEWGEFKTKMGTPSVRIGQLQYTLHSIPFSNKKVGYLPRLQPKDLDLDILFTSGKEHHCTHIKIDVPNAPLSYQIPQTKYQLLKTQPTFATATFMLEIAPSEEELLTKMHPKTRYNIKLAQKKGVRVERAEDINTFLLLQQETAIRQGFHLHPDKYYHTLWKMLTAKNMAYLLIATYQNKPLAAYFLMSYKDTFYYPYGGSSTEHKEVMANNLIMWEAIRLGKKIGCSQLDMWGALPQPVAREDPWYGFHRFKEGYGAELIEYPGAWDLIIDPVGYKLFQTADKIRWQVLKQKKRIRNVSYGS